MNWKAPLVAMVMACAVLGAYAVVAWPRGSNEEPLPFSPNPTVECAWNEETRALLREFAIPGRTGDELPDTATPTALEQRELELRTRGTEAAYRVVYRDTVTRHDEALISEDVERQLRACVRRVDQEVLGHSVADIYTETSSYECGNGGVPVCMRHPDLVAASRLAPSVLDVEFDTASVIDVGRLETREAERELTPSPTAMATVAPYAAEGRTVAAEPVVCFREGDGSVREERCYTSDGVLLYSLRDLGRARYEREAVEFSREVLQKDFELPYPVVTPTPYPFAPVSPPHADGTPAP